MQPQPKSRMMVDAFLAWAEDRPGRYELVDGVVFAMSPQRIRHIRLKFRVQLALRNAIRDRSLSCEMLADGATVRIDDWTSFEPDALVHCGAPLDPEAIAAPAPIVVVEVVSPGTKSIDTNRKLEGYFRLPSVMHYLVVDPAGPIVIHHGRDGVGGIAARILSSGKLDLAPPGLTIDLGDLFGPV